MSLLRPRRELELSPSGLLGLSRREGGKLCNEVTQYYYSCHSKPNQFPQPVFLAKTDPLTPSEHPIPIPTIFALWRVAWDGSSSPLGPLDWLLC